MTKFLGDSFSESFLNDVVKCKKSITIISPYITKGAVEKLIRCIPKACICKIITLPPGIEYLTGSIEIDALQILEKNHFSLLYLHNLHAKIYIIDESIAYLGSANFTSNGWNGKGKGNVEETIKIKLTNLDITYLDNRYILPSSKLELKEDLIETIKNGIEIQKRYMELINDLVVKIDISEPTGKIFYARQQPATVQFPFNYKYTLSKFTGEQIKHGKNNIICKLGGTKEKPDGEISVPYATLKKILTDSHSNSRKDWSFYVSFDHRGDPFLRSTNFKTRSNEIFPLEIQNFKGKLRKIEVTFK